MYALSLVDSRSRAHGNLPNREIGLIRRTSLAIGSRDGGARDEQEAAVRKAPATGRVHRKAPGRGLFPSTWPWRAWYSFEQDLLAAVYEKSGDLWHVLRDRCHDVTSWLQHLEYEGDIERSGSFNAATQLIASWPKAEAQLQQARNLLGKQVWDTLTSRALTKDRCGTETTPSDD
jgi:hypothetical protein